MVCPSAKRVKPQPRLRRGAVWIFRSQRPHRATWIVAAANAKLTGSEGCSMERRLAAVLMADVVGYSRLIEAAGA